MNKISYQPSFYTKIDVKVCVGLLSTNRLADAQNRKSPHSLYKCTNRQKVLQLRRAQEGSGEKDKWIVKLMVFCSQTENLGFC